MHDILIVCIYMHIYVHICHIEYILFLSQKNPLTGYNPFLLLVLSLFLLPGNKIKFLWVQSVESKFFEASYKNTTKSCIYVCMCICMNWLTWLLCSGQRRSS